jgi:hypothetical protein
MKLLPILGAEMGQSGIELSLAFAKEGATPCFADVSRHGRGIESCARTRWPGVQTLGGDKALKRREIRRERKLRGEELRIIESFTHLLRECLAGEGLHNEELSGVENAVVSDGGIRVAGHKEHFDALAE